MPQGPLIWICGDCHAGNLGPVANSEGKVEIQIRDLDQTVIGNPAHDLIRLGLSLATAARGNDLPGVTTAHMMEHMVSGYEKALTGRAGRTAEGEVAPIDEVMRRALRRQWRHLAEERIADVTPKIPLGDRFWALREDERGAIKELFATPEAVGMVMHLGRGAAEEAKDKVKVLDAAYWMKGCSSLGRMRYAVLLRVGRKGERRHCLIDIKEAVKAAAAAAKRLDEREDYAARVVSGAKALSPFLGERMMAATLLRRPVVLRELMPQDLKLEMDRMTQDEAVATAQYLAGVVGRAHARQMDAATRKSWKNVLSKGRSKSLEAPGWMWSSVVELVASHEAAYLEHCRRYAMVTS